MARSYTGYDIHSILHKKVVLTVSPDGSPDEPSGFVVAQVVAEEANDVVVVTFGSLTLSLHRQYIHVLFDDEPEPAVFNGLRRLG